MMFELAKDRSPEDLEMDRRHAEWEAKVANCAHVWVGLYDEDHVLDVYCVTCVGSLAMVHGDIPVYCDETTDAMYEGYETFVDVLIEGMCSYNYWGEWDDERYAIVTLKR